MRASRSERNGAAWLELLIALAFVAILLQMFPSLLFATLWALDIRNWPHTSWFWLNIGAVLALFGCRFGPTLYRDWRERQSDRAAEREKKQKQRELQEQRELLEQRREARKRRVF
jgi:predicted membrane metal-binding protein